MHITITTIIIDNIDKIILTIIETIIKLETLQTGINSIEIEIIIETTMTETTIKNLETEIIKIIQTIIDLIIEIDKIIIKDLEETDH